MIDVVRNDRVARLAINAPPVNVLDRAVLDELTGRLRELGEQEDLAAVLIEGAGRCFSAGASVAEHQPEQAPEMV
ncbi:MAG: enoyl-CoA hydratase, partial [Acidobacteria bacterium]|nr:enoyl-CoA hydratase [Acidobacteriota bacterium]